MGRAVPYRVARWTRTRAATVVLVALSVAVTLAPVLTLLAGARRTASAPDRYVAAQASTYDVTIWQSDGAPMTDRIAALPGVARISMATFLFAALTPQEATSPLEAAAFAGPIDAIGGRLVAGRSVDPSQPGEFVASDSWVALGDAELGDTFTLDTISQSAATLRGYDAAFDGPTLQATLVGVFENRVKSLEEDFPVAVFGRSLLDAHDPGAIGVSGSTGAIDLEPGTDIDRLRRELDTLADGHQVSVMPVELIGQPVVSAVETQADALWVVAVIAAGAAAVVLTQLLVRLVRTAADERGVLVALGYTGRQSDGETMLRATTPVLLGIAVASIVAWLCSAWFPYGFASVVEPDPGRRFDVVAQVAAAALGAALLLAAATLFGRERRVPAGRRRSLDHVAARIPSPTAATGAHLAFGRSRRAGAANAFVVGIGVVLAVAVAALTVGSGLDRLLDTPANWGADFDLGYGQGGTVIDDRVVDVLASDPAVSAVTLYGATTVAVGSEPLGIVAFSPVEGGRVPRVLEGRLPQAGDEAAFGTSVAQRLGVRVGDRITVRSPGGDVELTMVGLAVVPGIEETDSTGDAALVSEEGLARLDPGDALSSAAIYLAADAPPDTAARLTAALGGDAVGPVDRPSSVVNLDRIRNVPYVIGAVVGALALLSLTQIVATAVRRRRHDLAVLRALGATTGWRRRVVHWQATLLGAAAALVAVPIGVIAGRAVYRSYPERIGAPVEPQVPVAWIVVVVIGLVVAANVVAAITIGRLRGATHELRTE